MIKKRRPGFSLHLRQKKGIEGGICHQDNSTEFPNASLSFTNCSSPAQYVYLENRRDSDVKRNWSRYPNLELVEVEVFADTGMIFSLAITKERFFHSLVVSIIVYVVAMGKFRHFVVQWILLICKSYFSEKILK